MRFVALAVVLALPAPAAAYDFEIAARTIGQAYQVVYGDLDLGRVLERRRFTQTLSLDVWNILEPSFDPGRPDPPPLAPFDVYVTARFRLQHDFGEYTRGDVIHALTPTREIEEAATSAVPELAGGDLSLEVLEAAAGARGIFDRLDVAVGRQLMIDSFDWYAIDGLSLDARLPAHVRVFVHGGFLVRDASPLASATMEPDGTGSAQCTIIPDPDIPADLRETSCGGRDRPAPTFGVGAATHGLRWLSARLSYRRSISPTTEVLTPQLGGAAPAWGVLEEKLAFSARGVLWDGKLVPWMAARWNFLLALLDEADAGVRLAQGAHALTGEARWSSPSFDGDSIFNVFSFEPYLDLRVGYDLDLGRARAAARGYWRRYGNSDVDKLAPGETIDDPAISAGATLSGGLQLGSVTTRLDLRYEDGQGGLRAGGELAAWLRVTRRLTVDGRASLFRFEDDLRVEHAATTFGAEAGARLLLGKGMNLHVLAEQNANRFDRSLRLLALLDLTFRPEH